MSEIPATSEVLTAKRDALGQLCFVLHLAVMLFIVLGWLAPARSVLVFYLTLLPAVVVQWWFNKNACVLNNAESLLRTGRWRHAANPEEGAWLQTLIRGALGLEFKPVLLEALVYVLMVLFWGLGFAHFLRS